jgi:RNA polymerase sigma factor (sigma-70 family)
MVSSGGEHISQTLVRFEGLVIQTARMYASQVGREESDLAQELRVRVWKAIEAYNPRRTTLPLERFVFGCVRNKMKDFFRDAAREKARREREGVSFVCAEDLGAPEDSMTGEERFERYHFVTREQVYGRVEGAVFVLPATVTETEARVAILLVQEVSRLEISVRLDMTDAEITAAIRALREKLRDWKASPGGAAEARPSRQLELAA